MKIKIWGTRGSIPVPGPNTVKYGGNTHCVEIRYGEEDHLLIIDAGTGIRPLANHLVTKQLPKGPIKAQLFFTHTHWDHIMGFPFFIPIFIPGTELQVYGPVTYENEGLETVIGGQLQYRYFPVKHSELSANIEYFPLKECTLELPEGMQLKTKYLNHPILCLGYRFEWAGKSICTIYDHEPFRNIFPTDPTHPEYDPFIAEEGEQVAQEENARIHDFYQGVDLLIHDCQYTQEEYESSKLGWGHSFFDYTVQAAEEGGVKTLVLSHHDPMRTDDALDELGEYCRSLLPEKTAMDVHIAYEGQEFLL